MLHIWISKFREKFNIDQGGKIQGTLPARFNAARNYRACIKNPRHDQPGYLPLQRDSTITKLKQYRSTGRINTLFSLFHQEKKDIKAAVQLWVIRNLTDFDRHAQYRLKRLLSPKGAYFWWCSFPPVNPATLQPPGMPTTYHFFSQTQ